MSTQGSPIECHECDEIIDAQAGSCPHCGASVRSNLYLIGPLVFGGILVVVSLLDIGSLWFFGLIGALLAAVCGALLYDKRQRIERASNADLRTDDETEEDLFEV